MATKKELTKEERVKKEYNRLKRLYKELPKDLIQLVDGLLWEAADLRIRLEEIRQDLDDNGYDDMFSQSPTQEPYERERPQARRYISLNKNYQTIMKQLGDRLPKYEAPSKEPESDGFDEFARER